ncbi:MAG: aminotransferase class I/II-fold pyridoxal phosphate-dependent enzyme, partial [Bacteroidales bacterium]|nr:aminotransferase class I/II-fold pyridoxal phosphate-dependent enzyme [Bacteroidales bacterium]
IISDEVYREFCYSDEKYFSALNLEGVDDNVIVIDSVSKRFNLCGTRVGFVVSKNKDVMTAVLKFALARLCSPKLGQMASVGALKVDESYYTAVREEYIRRRNLLVSELNKIPGVLCPTPNGAFYAPTRLPVDDAEKFAKWMLTDFNYNGKTVLLTPMAGFYATPGMGINEVRIAYVLKEEDIIGAVECLAKGLEAYPGRTI